jgi:hypothetical protein
MRSEARINITEGFHGRFRQSVLSKFRDMYGHGRSVSEEPTIHKLHVLKKNLKKYENKKIECHNMLDLQSVSNRR